MADERTGLEHLNGRSCFAMKIVGVDGNAQTVTESLGKIVSVTQNEFGHLIFEFDSARLVVIGVLGLIYEVTKAELESGTGSELRLFLSLHIDGQPAIYAP